MNENKTCLRNPSNEEDFFNGVSPTHNGSVKNEKRDSVTSVKNQSKRNGRKKRNCRNYFARNRGNRCKNALPICQCHKEESMHAKNALHGQSGYKSLAYDEVCRQITLKVLELHRLLGQVDVNLILDEKQFSCTELLRHLKSRPPTSR